MSDRMFLLLVLLQSDIPSGSKQQ